MARPVTHANPRLDQRLFLGIASRLLADGLAVRFRASGFSMSPAIQDGDVITVGPVDAATIKPGDVILYRQGQRSFAHRVRQVLAGAGGGPAFVARGDAKAADDAPIALEQLLGRVEAVERPGGSIAARACGVFARALRLDRRASRAARVQAGPCAAHQAA